jgi:hypothetical protein
MRVSFDWLARRPFQGAALVCLLSFGFGPLLAGLTGFPQPVVQDEFSNLLAADTFFHGRLTNPPHPLWPSFESLHVIQQPTYASKYPPGHGLMLAAGRVVGGDSIVGVWLEAALACGGIYWMLRAWLPPRWALWGGLLATVHPLFLHWEQNYYGGSLAALGGALVLGGIRRIMRDSSVKAAVILAVGIALLANTRPFEGFVFSVLAMTPLLAWVAGRLRPASGLLFRLGLPVLSVLACTALFMAFYNFRVTGNPLLLPYEAYELTYSRTPCFIFQSLRPELAYRHESIKAFYATIGIADYQLQRESLSSLVLISLTKLWCYLGNYFRIFTLVAILPLGLLASPRSVALSDPWLRFALAMGALFLALLSLPVWAQWHYAAPAMGLVIYLEMACLRAARSWRWRGRPSGKLFFRVSLAVSVLYAVAWSCKRQQLEGEEGWRANMGQRAKLVEWLEAADGQHLVLVRYDRSHDPRAEWVYNGADIDGSRVVWAREMDDDQNRCLRDYFSGRRAWIVEADASVPRLVPLGQRSVMRGKPPGDPMTALRPRGTVEPRRAVSRAAKPNLSPASLTGYARLSRGSSTDSRIGANSYSYAPPSHVNASPHAMCQRSRE